MSVYKDKSTGCWWVSCRFKDINGVTRRTTKPGLQVRRGSEAVGGRAQGRTLPEVSHPIAVLQGLHT